MRTKQKAVKFKSHTKLAPMKSPEMAPGEEKTRPKRATKDPPEQKSATKTEKQKSVGGGTKKRKRTGKAAIPPAKASKSRLHQIRSTLATLVNAMNDVRGHIQKDHIEMWKKTPFFLLFKSIYDYKLTAPMCTKQDSNIISLVKKFNSKTRKMEMGRNLLQIKLQKSDLKLIFGIMDGDREMTPTSKGGKRMSEFVERVFPNAQQLTGKLMKDKLKELLKAHPRSVEDSARVLCMILLGSFFFPTTGRILHWGYVELVEDLESIRDYDWCGMILNTLIKSMVTKTKEPSRVNGCSVFLLYWFCEHTTIFTPSYRLNIPRCAKWNLQTITQDVNMHTFDNLTDGQIITWELEQTPQETKAFEMFGKRTVGEIVSFTGKEHQIGKETIHKHVEKEGDDAKDNADLDRTIEKLGMPSFELFSQVHNLDGEKDKGKEKEVENEEIQEVFVEGALIDNQQILEEEDSEHDWMGMELLCQHDDPIFLYNGGMAPTIIEYKGKRYRIEQLISMLDNLEDKVQKLEHDKFMTDAENETLKFQMNELIKQHKKETDLIEKQKKEYEKFAGISAEIYNEIEELQRRNETREKERRLHSEEVHQDKQVVTEEGKRKDRCNSLVRHVKETDCKKTSRLEDFKISASRKLVPKKRKVDTVAAQKQKKPAPKKKTLTKKSFLAGLKRSNPHNCAKFLSEACLEVLLDAFQENDKTLWYKKGEPYFVSCTDIKKILHGHYISTGVVGVYSMEMVRRPDFDGRSVIIRSDSYSMLVCSKISDKTKIFQMFTESSKRNQKILFPFVSNGRGRTKEANHWTLLVFSHDESKWSFYTSLQSRVSAGVTDYYFEDAKELISVIEKNTTPSGSMSTIEYVQNLPQQGATCDCAIYVCYYMTQLIFHEEIKTNWPLEEMNKFKADIIERIVMATKI